jgi:ribosome-associated translation inhibitor RaiA
MSIINRYNNTGFELKFQFHSKFGGNLKEISILKSGNTIIMQTLATVHWLAIDHLRNRLNFDLNKSKHKFHHSLKEHHKISDIPKFRCEML